MSADELIARIAAAGEEFAGAIAPLSDEQSIPAAQAQFLGKKGRLSALMRDLAQLPPAERPRVGEAMNRVKQAIEAAVTARLDELVNAVRAQDLARVVDVTLPGRPIAAGTLHLLTQV